MTRLVRQASAAWNAFWFGPGSPFNLAAARVIVAAHALWIVLSRDYGAISGLPELWGRVPNSLRWRYLLFEGHPALEHALQWGATAALLGALLGFYPRVCSAVAAVLLYHLAPLESIIWTASPKARGLTIAPVALLILSCSRSDARLTLWPRRAPGDVPWPWEHGWPLRLIQLVVCQIYLFAAYGKLVETGLSWSSAENMRRWFLLFNLDDRVFRGPGLWIAGVPFLCLAIGVAAVVFEWGFILALFRPSARRWLVPLALAFHAVILLTMNIHVGEAWLVLVFVDWERLVRLRSTQGSVPAPRSSDDEPAAASA